MTEREKAAAGFLYDANYYEELAADERDDLSFVWEAVKSLPVKYREVIHLFYHEGCSVREISKYPQAPGSNSPLRPAPRARAAQRNSQGGVRLR